MCEIQVRKAIVGNHLSKRPMANNRQSVQWTSGKQGMHWFAPKSMRTKLDANWKYGSYLGRSLSSDQNIIAVQGAMW